MISQGRSPMPLVALFIALALVTSACFGGPPTPPNTGGQTGGDEPDPNGELILNTGDEPDTIDPHRASFVDEVAIIMSVFEGLMTLDPTTLKPVPAVAAKDPEVNADSTVWKFTLRDDVKFSDGTPVTAQDFERGFLRTCDPTTAGGYAFVLYVIVGCEEWNNMTNATAEQLAAARAATGVKALDAKTIEFRLREPAAYFGSIAYMWVGMPVQQKSLDQGGEQWTEPSKGTYIGNGPFKLVEWKHNQELVLERNENYYKGVPKLKRIRLVMISEGAAAFSAYRNNDLDVFGASGEDLRTINSEEELKAQAKEVQGACTFYIGYNSQRPPFDDPKVRLAFAKSFDRNAYISDVQKLGTPANGGFIPPGLPGYDDADKAQSFDAAAAKSLLASSAHFGSAALQNVRFTYASNARTKTRVEWLQQQWKTNLGIEVVPDPVDSTAYTQLTKDPATLPLMFILGWCADFPHQQNWLTTVFHSGSLSNTGWKNETFDRMVKEADQDPDPARAGAKYLEASRLLSQEAPAAWLYYGTGMRLMKPWVKGVTSTAIDAQLGQFRLHEIYVTKKG